MSAELKRSSLFRQKMFYNVDHTGKGNGTSLLRQDDKGQLKMMKLNTSVFEETKIGYYVSLN